jgi:putative addiction module killer protein
MATCRTSKGLADGALEYRVDFGPGYRIYLGRDGGRLVILLAGGTKKRQQLDVRQAQLNWEDYRKRKTQEKKDGTDQRLS